MNLKTNAKKFFLIYTAILSLFISATKCFAYDVLNLNLGSNYLITTDSPVSASAVGNCQILTLTPFFTIFNEKNVLLVHLEKVGKTKIVLFMNNSEVVFDIDVKPENKITTFKSIKLNGVEFNLLDQPPVFERFEIDTPPSIMEGK